MLWARMLAYFTWMVNQELLLRNECLAPEDGVARQNAICREYGASSCRDKLNR
jgi:hypothetical protein